MEFERQRQAQFFRILKYFLGPFVTISISEDGKFVDLKYWETGKTKQLKINERGRAFLRNEDVKFVGGEDFLEPEDVRNSGR